ncbi:MAG: Rv1535 family protein [Mycobacterium sp.]|uniref:Rv1535 family protein n=1 Tax=Mycobacterium sp. TaxID=1785 RepID=UPI003F94A8B6
MTAVLLDDVDVVDVATTQPAARLAVTPAPQRATKRVRRAPIDTGGDPMVDATTRLLSIPLRHVYAALWRMGLIEVR